jgi:hypothetical protein
MLEIILNMFAIAPQQSLDLLKQNNVCEKIFDEFVKNTAYFEE